jgi:glycosyltransferase involved in cell wall biosynthesis
MKIVVVCGAGMVYGKELSTLNLLDGLLARGHRIMCLTSTWGDPDLERRLDARAIPYTRLPLGFISKTLTWSAVSMTLDQIFKLPYLWAGYRKTIKAFKPDVVIHSNFHHLVVLWLVIRRETNVFHVHDYMRPTQFYKFVFKILERRLSRLIGVSKFIAISLSKLGLPQGKIEWVLNGIVMEGLNRNQYSELSSAAGTSTDGTTTLPKDDKLESAAKREHILSIGIVGQVGEWKGHGDLVDALNLVKRAGCNFSFKIFGDGDPSYASALRRKISDYGLDSQVEWAGFVKDRHAIYSSMDLCVVPSKLFEPFGLVAAEAAAHGIPVIATNRGGLPEIVLDNQTGYLVEPGSPEQLAAKLGLLLDSESLRVRIGAAARQHASRHLSNEQMAKAFEEVLLSLS